MESYNYAGSGHGCGRAATDKTYPYRGYGMPQRFVKISVGNFLLMFPLLSVFFSEA